MGTRVRCPSCSGRGFVGGNPYPCQQCAGSGVLVVARGETLCLVCERKVRVGFADNGEHAQGAEHIENYARKFSAKAPAV